ncbi:MAG: hypothetical protein QM500_13100 [Methylococcales bacterium]
MSNRFDSVPVENDTRILFRHEMKFGEYDILYEKWCWDGISAESIIFASEDVAGLSDKQLEFEVRSSPLLRHDTCVTVKSTESGFTFVNFNFLS